MLAKQITQVAKSLIKISIVCGIFLVPVTTSASEGDTLEKTNKVKQNSRKNSSYTIQSVLEQSIFQNEIFKDEEIEIENWMSDVHDPFWNEVSTNEEEEYAVESWMFNPSEWETKN